MFVVGLLAFIYFTWVLNHSSLGSIKEQEMMHETWFVFLGLVFLSGIFFVMFKTPRNQ